MSVYFAASAQQAQSLRECAMCEKRLPKTWHNHKYCRVCIAVRQTESHRKSRLKPGSRERRLGHQRKQRRINMQNPAYRLKKQRQERDCYYRRMPAIKTEVLSHYRKEGRLQCCSPGCLISDMDILSLDHINDDGAEHRRQGILRGGFNFYKQLRKDGFPAGYQTLCFNCQLKKEILRRRANRIH